MSATLNLLAGAELIFADERRGDGGGKKTIIRCRYVGNISQQGGLNDARIFASCVEERIEDEEDGEDEEDDGSGRGARSRRRRRLGGCALAASVREET